MGLSLSGAADSFAPLGL